MKNFADRLCDAVLEKNSRAIVGIDPRPELLPSSLGRDAGACAMFSKMVIDAAEPYVCGVKPQSAFFEALGVAGMKAYADTVAHARKKGLIVIGDVKRGDIGSTAEAYAAGYLAPGSDFEADAVTVNAYLGLDGVKPFLDQCRRNGKGIFVLVRTSNPSAGDLQDIGGNRGVWRRLAGMVNLWGKNLVGKSGYSSVGAVVGATYPEDAAVVRKLAPEALLLMPGVGAQGADPAGLEKCFDVSGLGAVVPSSRGIMFAFRKNDKELSGNWQDLVANAAREMRDELNAVIGKEK